MAHSEISSSRTRRSIIFPLSQNYRYFTGRIPREAKGKWENVSRAAGEFTAPLRMDDDGTKDSCCPREFYSNGYWMVMVLLTDNIQRVQQGHLGLRIDLALVHSWIPHLGIFDLQRPVGGARRSQNLKPLIGGVRGSARRQNVQISLPDPRHLVNRAMGSC